ncbi:MAG: hypothetical protein ACI9LO_000583 [Planctomycetota bacterium]
MSGEEYYGSLPRSGASFTDSLCVARGYLKILRTEDSDVEGAHSPRVKHGYYSKSAIDEREWLRELLKGVDVLLDDMVG